MIETWLIPQPNSPLHRLYGQIDVVEITDPTEEVKVNIGEEIVASYRELDFLKVMYSQKPENELRAYIKNYVLPSEKNTITKNVRQGDFSEVLASLIVGFFQKRIVPLKKMKWKFNKDRSVFSTDMFAHNDGPVISDLYYYEIKSRLGIRKEYIDPLSAYVTIHAHNSLNDDQQQPSEAIADFLSRLYFENGEPDTAKKYHDIVHNPGNYKRGFELFFIIETNQFKQEILDDLQNLPPALSPLAVTIVLIKNLGRLIIDLQNRAIEQAVNYVYDK